MSRIYSTKHIYRNPYIRLNIDIYMSLSELMVNPEWKKELEKIGISQELFEAILAAAPARQFTLGYPQVRIQRTYVQENR